MNSVLQKTGIFLGVLFLVALPIGLAPLYLRTHSLLAVLVHPNTWIMLGISALMFVSAYFPAFSWLQPLCFIACAPVNIIGNHSSIYGLGFYVIGVLLLFRLGFFEKRKVFKLVLALFFLLGIEIYSGIKAGRGLVYAFTPVFFIAAFLLMLYLAYKEKLMVYLKEPKPRLSLDEKGLSPAEKTYVLAVLAGRNHKEIAVDYEVSDSTVRNTISRAYQKLEVSDKAGLAVLAERFEIVV